MKIVAIATEERMRRNSDRYEQITVLAGVWAGMALSRNSYAGTVFKAGRNIDHHRFGPHIDLPSAANRAPRVSLDARTSAPRARLRKHHVPARRLDDARSLALGATPLHRRQTPEAAAGAAVDLPRDGDFVRAATHRLIERERQCVMKIRPTLGSVTPRFLTSMQNFAEQIAKG